MQEISKQRAFDGVHIKLQHSSKITKCDMNCALYLPPNYQRSDAQIPLLLWLSGLTCNEENFMQKAGALSHAASLGWAILCPDTSPRGKEVPDATDGAWDLGIGAGFYVNASQAPWKEHYQMYDYICDELLSLVADRYPKLSLSGISGHSMGGHGALVIGLKNRERFNSISAFSPIVNPIDCPWGKKAFSEYLGEHHDTWRQYDSCELIKDPGRFLPLLIDQGSDDSFLEEQLKPQNLVQAANVANYPIVLNMQAGYDHSYFFVSSFINKHLDFHHSHFVRSTQKSTQ